MKWLSRQIIAFVAVVAVAVPTGSADAAGKTVVVSQAFQSLLYLPFYVAMDAGFFEKQGLRVKKETAGSPTVALQAVISGSADYSIHGPEWVAIAQSRGGSVQTVANVVNGAAVWIATTPDFKYTSIKDLKGQTVVTGMMPTTSTSLFMKLLKENGLDPEKDVKMIQVPIGTEINPFLAGQAKVAVLYEPGLDQAVSQGMKVVVSFPRLYGPYFFSTVATRPDADPDTTQRLVNALEMGIRYLHAHPDEAVRIAKTEFPNLDPKVVESAVRRMIADKVYPESVAISPEAFEIAMETQVFLGNLKEAPLYDRLINTTYIKKALTTK
ncbi:ABC transporter substrate-binding protein [Pelomicrobium methylotrophicum]|uniref:ABC transporter substrate-binding protein n=1 Tax=Pelomicrobium methylotrophicum TaxID=2602750 RepID=A0A5C7EH10_9PROT|nr:ABC transporter substrate-binding protein [Pelomicrobium methylotrophicum]TXF10587.1 ABC transporter substrate-binding protein [Pelomicrobium methylotrophicum]